VTSWLVLSASQKSSVQPGWYLPPQKIDPKEEFRLCFPEAEWALSRGLKNPMEALPGLESLAHGNSPRLGPRIQEDSLLHGVPSQM